MLAKFREITTTKPWLIRIILLGVILGMVALIMPQIILILDPFTPGEQKSGTVTRIQYPQTHYESITYVFITLDDGTKIQVDGTRMGNVQQGQRVIVQEFRSKIFHLKRYEFVRYESSYRDESRHYTYEELSEDKASS